MKKDFDREQWHKDKVFQGKLFTKDFTEDEVELAREVRLEKDKMAGYDYLGTHNENRWVGDMGEFTFKEYLDMHGGDFHHFLDDKKIDFLDFKLGGFQIDVKTTARNYRPKLNYACSITRAQYDAASKWINTYVFASYHLGENRCYLLGYMTRPEFDIQKSLVEEGTVLGSGNPAQKDFYKVSVDQLNTLGQLMMFWRQGY